MTDKPSTTFSVEVRWTNLADLSRLAARLEPLWRPPGIILLDGELGVGKTTLVQDVLRAAGVADAVKSPTFDLVHPHEGARGRYLHVDLYRLNPPPAPEELDVFTDDALAIVEWGAGWLPYFPEHLAGFMALSDFDRRMRLDGTGAWAGRLARWVQGDEEVTLS